MSTYGTEFPTTEEPLQEQASSRLHDAADQLKERGQQLQERGQQLVSQADRYVRENPIPVVVGALAVGFALGLLARGSSEPETRYSRFASRLEDTEDQMRSLADAIVKAAKKNMRKSSSAVMHAVDDAVSAARKVDVDDYVEPVSGWFKKLFS